MGNYRITKSCDDDTSIVFYLVWNLAEIPVRKDGKERADEKMFLIVGPFDFSVFVRVLDGTFGKDFGAPFIGVFSEPEFIRARKNYPRCRISIRPGKRLFIIQALMYIKHIAYGSKPLSYLICNPLVPNTSLRGSLGLGFALGRKSC